MSTTTTSKTTIDIRGLSPLILVFDIQRSLLFYCDVLGFELVSSDNSGPDYGWVLLSSGKTELMMEPIYPKDQKPVDPDASRTAHHKDTVLYFGCPDVDAAYAHLISKGISVKEPRIAYYGMKQLYLTDPDGYLLCFQWPVSQQAIDEWEKRYGFQP